MSKEEKEQQAPQEGEEEATNPEKERVEQERKLSEPDDADGEDAEGTKE